MGVKSVWHVGLSVRDIERSIAFYRDCLGLPLRHRQLQENEYTSNLVGYPNVRITVAQFQLPGENPGSGHVLELTEYERPRGAEVDISTPNIGVAHLAFEVGDIDVMRPTLEAGGARFVSEPQEIAAGINKGGRAVYLRDPDGFTLELIEPPPSFGERVLDRPDE